MNNFMRFFNKNQKNIFLAVAVVIFVILIIVILNQYYIAQEENNQKIAQVVDYSGIFKLMMINFINQFVK